MRLPSRVRSVSGWPLVAASFAAAALSASSLSAADARLQHLTDQLRGRTARLVFETAGLFGDAANYRALDRNAKAMHDTAESLARTDPSFSASHERLDKDLATLAHYRVQFGKECDVLGRELRGLWGASLAGSFVEDDLRVLLFRLDSIARLGAAIDRHVHPGRPSGTILPDALSSRPGTRCPADVIPLPELPDAALPGGSRPVDPRPVDPVPSDPRPADPLPADPRPLDPLPLPPGSLGTGRIPPGSLGIEPGRRLPGLPGADVGSRIPVPGIGGGSIGSAGTGRIPGIPSGRLLPGVADVIREGLGRPEGGSSGSAGGSTGSSTGRLPGMPGGGVLPGLGGIRIPVPRR